jgi:prepilin-type N-terminal cleavage/methylation domain-containing protein
VNERGVSLLEVLVALLLLGLSLLAVVPMFLTATRSTASAGEISTLSAVAGQRMEWLRQIPFDSLTAGGSLTTNQSGFFDTSDPGFVVRWRITDDATPPTVKTVEVWARALRSPVGLPKETTLFGQVAQ